MAKTQEQPIREGMRAEYAYAHIKRLIMEGHFQGGDRIDVKLFVKKLEVSRQPIVRALARLANEKLVEVVPQVGCWVATVEPSEISDFFRLFSATEALAAELAAERRTQADLDALQAIHARVGTLLTGKRDVHAYRIMNREFHGQVHAMAHSAVVRDAGMGMWDRCDFLLCTLGRNLIALRFDESHQEHAQLLAALSKRSGATARRLMHEHIAAFAAAAMREAEPATPTRTVSRAVR